VGHRRSTLGSYLSDKGVRSLVITGSETVVCVLATALDAADRGFRVSLVENALCSSSDPGRDVLTTLYCTRFPERIEIIKAEELPSVWREGL
jgi:nicotinamidase-related amidase